MKKLLYLLLIPVLAGIGYLVWQNLPSKRYAKHLVKARLYVKENNLTAAIEEYEKAYSAQGKYTPYASMEVLGLTNYMSIQNKKPQEAFNNTRMYVQENPNDKDGKIILAQMAFQMGDMEAAFDAIEALLKIDPWYFPARLLLTSVRAKQGRLDLAEEQLRYLAGKYPDSTQALLPLAEILIQRGQINESRAFLHQIIAKQPKNTKARLLMVDSYLRERKVDSAHAFLDNWMTEDPENMQQLQLRKARLFALTNKLPEAMAALSAYTEKKEANSAALSELAVLYAKTGHYDSSIAIYKALGEIFPAGKSRSQIMMYYLYMKNQNPARALEALKTLLIGDKRITLMSPLIAAYVAIGQDNKATAFIEQQADSLKPSLNEFKASLVVDKDFIGQWALITFFGLNNHEAMAFDAIKEFHQRWPTNIMAITMYTGSLSSIGAFAEATKILATLPKLNLTQEVAMLQLLAKSRQMEKAIQLAEKLGAEHPNLGGVNSILADYWMKKDKAKAIAYYDKELTINPDNLIVLNNLAWEYGINQSNLEKAGPYLEKLKARKNLDPRILDTVGWILAMNGKLEEGEKNIRNALDLVPDYPVFKYHLAFILAKAGKKEEAKKLLETALTSKIEFEERSAAEKLLAEQG